MKVRLAVAYLINLHGACISNKNYLSTLKNENYTKLLATT